VFEDAAVATMEGLWGNYPQRNAINYTVHISEEFNFIYIHTAKAGCSATKATLNLACARRLGVALRYADMEDIHARGSNILKSPRQVGARRFLEMLNDPRVMRFCILREPESRIASAFASKLRNPSPQRKRLNALLDLPPDRAWPDINEFVSVVTFDAKIRDADEHWRLQYNQVCAAHVPYTLVGFQEELEASLQAFAHFVFREAIEIFDVRAHFPENASPSREAQAALSEESRERIRTAYAPDFDLYEREWTRMHAPGGPLA
jgi:hypothetical protein